jgi:hypothetical protein
MGVEIERGLQIVFQINWGKLSFSFHVFHIALLLLNTQKNICRPVACPITQKLLNLVTKGEKYWKALGDMRMFGEGQFTLVIQHISINNFENQILNCSHIIPFNGGYGNTSLHHWTRI